MYNLSGLFYEMKCEGLVFGLTGLLFLSTSNFWNVKKRDKKAILTGSIFSLLCICSLVYHAYVISNLHISTHEGAFVEEHREHISVIRKNYTFSNENGLRPRFYLDIFSKKEIYPEDFEEDVFYRIYYEEKTNIIVKVEKLQ